MNRTRWLARCISSGYSLPELLAGLLITSLLLTFAVPGYQHVTLKVRRSQGRSALYATLVQQEQHRLAHQRYQPFDAANPATPFKWWSGTEPADSYYEIRASPCPDLALSECIRLLAIPGTANVHNHADPDCGTLVLDSRIGHTVAAADPDSRLCW